QPDPAMPATGGAPVGPSGNPAGPGPDQMYDISLQQYRRGSLATARLGFREFLRVFPTHERAPDALFYIGESFEQAAPDSAAAVYDQVVKTYPKSPRAPSALYKQGLLAEQRGDKPTARTFYSRVIATYPRSPEADLARQVAFALGCVVASPVVIYQIWAFLSPALYERERRLIVPALAVGVVLFLAGAIACYQWLLPAALKVLLGFQRTDLTAMITID